MLYGSGILSAALMTTHDGHAFYGRHLLDILHAFAWFSTGSKGKGGFACGGCLFAGDFPQRGLKWFNGLTLQLCQLAGDAVYQVPASFYVYKYHGSSAPLLASVWDIASGQKSFHHQNGEQPA